MFFEKYVRRKHEEEVGVCNCDPGPYLGSRLYYPTGEVYNLCGKCQKIINSNVKPIGLWQATKEYRSKYIVKHTGLKELYEDLGKLKWIGADEGWNLAIEAVRKEILRRLNETTTTTNR